MGFTLIELLVVISIIGLLSSVVLASVNTARLSARDAAIRLAAHQFIILANYEYNDNTNYGNAQLPNVATWNSCNQFVSGNYATQFTAICNQILALSAVGATPPWGSGIRTVYGNSGTLANGWQTNTAKFAMMVWLPGKAKYLCIGSNGQTSETTTVPDGSGNWSQPGCYGDPTL